MSDGLNENWGPLGIGDLSTEGTSVLSVRDATSTTTLPTNTTRIKVNTSGGAVFWHGPANSNTLDWQTIQFWWESGLAISAALNGVTTANNATATVITGTTSISGPIVIGAAGGAAANGKWPGLVDELRICKLARSDAWRLLEHLSFTDPNFTTIGAEETPGDAPVDTITAVADDFTEAYVAGGSVLIDVLANDTHSSGAALFVQNPTVAGGGTCVVESNKLRYTWPSTFNAGGVATGTYEVTDGGTLLVSSTWRVEVTAPFDGGDLFLNPFNKRAAHHRPVGAGAVHYIKGGIRRADWDANPRRNVYEPDLSPAASITELRNRIGDFVVGNSAQGRKYNYRVKTTDPEVTWNRAGAAAGSVKMRTPALQETTGGPLPYIPDFTGGDFENGFAPVNGITSPYMMQRFNDCDYANKEYSSENLFDLALTDNAETGGGLTGGAGLRWPGMTLRGHEINATNPANPINHAFNVAVTRHSRVAMRRLLDNGQPNPQYLGRRVPEAHILSDGILWPASRTDGSLVPGNKDYDPVESPLENQGPLAYGSLLVVRDQDRDTVAGLPAFSGNPRGLRMLDAMVYYGCYVVDGHGQLKITNKGAPNERVQGVMQMRIEGNVGQDQFGNDIPNVISDINKALRAMIPHLYCVGNRLLWTNIRGEDAPNGLPYHGGSKLLSTGKRQWVLNAANPTRSLNTAWDAPSPGYQADT
jgi:hypothetical protein